MLKTITILLTVAGLSPARSDLTHDQDRAMTLMSTYCAACHAIEPLRFIVSDSNAVNWAYIHENGPDNRNTWAQTMTKLLDWPTSDPKQLKDPQFPLSRWMPVGQKRYSISEEMVDHRNARQFLLDIVSNSLEP